MAVYYLGNQSPFSVLISLKAFLEIDYIDSCPLYASYYSCTQSRLVYRGPQMRCLLYYNVTCKYHHFNVPKPMLLLTRTTIRIEMLMFSFFGYVLSLFPYNSFMVVVCLSRTGSNIVIKWCSFGIYSTQQCNSLHPSPKMLRLSFRLIWKTKLMHYTEQGIIPDTANSHIRQLQYNPVKTES
jgi:hypothetical protein